MERKKVLMDDIEFDVLDELYFVISFQDLQSNLDLDAEEILDTLIKLTSNGWVRVYENSEDELDEYDLISNFKTYFYLASKKGLLAHNKQ